MTTTPSRPCYRIALCSTFIKMSLHGRRTWGSSIPAPRNGWKYNVSGRIYSLSLFCHRISRYSYQKTQRTLAPPIKFSDCWWVKRTNTPTWLRSFAPISWKMTLAAMKICSTHSIIFKRYWFAVKRPWRITCRLSAKYSHASSLSLTRIWLTSYPKDRTLSRLWCTWVRLLTPLITSTLTTTLTAHRRTRMCGRWYRCKASGWHCRNRFGVRVRCRFD